MNDDAYYRRRVVEMVEMCIIFSGYSYYPEKTGENYNTKKHKKRPDINPASIVLQLLI